MTASLTYSPAAPQTKKRKLEEVDNSKVKKSKTNGEEEDEEEEDFPDDAPEEDDDEEEAAGDDEENEPAVKTKIIKGSESKQAAVEADDEEYEAEA